MYKCLNFGGKVAFQFYPSGKDQVELISNAAMKSGFSGGIIVDYPNSAIAKKYYLVLSTAHQGKMEIKMVDGLNEGDSDAEADGGKRRTKRKIQKVGKNGKFEYKSKLWVASKKERQRKQGKNVVINDSKFSGRRRGPKF